MISSKKLIISCFMFLLSYSSIGSSDVKSKLGDNVEQDLRDYKAKGIGFSISPNLALVKDKQKQIIEVKYYNNKGGVKFRKYKANIDLIGIKLEAAVKFNLVIFTDEFNYYDSDKVIELGTGIEIIFGSFVGALYIPFINMPGGIFILNFSFPIYAGVFSLVKGGTLTPIN